jgi:hypothetical protein
MLSFESVEKCPDALQVDGSGLLRILLRDRVTHQARQDHHMTNVLKGSLHIHRISHIPAYETITLTTNKGPDSVMVQIDHSV